MINKLSLNRSYETIAFGVFLIWWGFTQIVHTLPEGAGTIGIGLILLGLNAARSLKRIPTSGFTITLGILALVAGGLELAQPILHFSFEMPTFAILLIVIGGILLVRDLGKKK